MITQYDDTFLGQFMHFAGYPYSLTHDTYQLSMIIVPIVVCLGLALLWFQLKILINAATYSLDMDKPLPRWANIPVTICGINLGATVLYDTTLFLTNNPVSILEILGPCMGLLGMGVLLTVAIKWNDFVATYKLK